MAKQKANVLKLIVGAAGLASVVGVPLLVIGRVDDAQTKTVDAVVEDVKAVAADVEENEAAIHAIDKGLVEQRVLLGTVLQRQAEIREEVKDSFKRIEAKLDK